MTENKRNQMTTYQVIFWFVYCIHLSTLHPRPFAPSSIPFHHLRLANRQALEQCFTAAGATVAERLWRKRPQRKRLLGEGPQQNGRNRSASSGVAASGAATAGAADGRS